MKFLTHIEDKRTQTVSKKLLNVCWDITIKMNVTPFKGLQHIASRIECLYAESTELEKDRIIHILSDLLLGDVSVIDEPYLSATEYYLQPYAAPQINKSFLAQLVEQLQDFKAEELQKIKDDEYIKKLYFILGQFPFDCENNLHRIGLLVEHLKKEWSTHNIENNSIMYPVYLYNYGFIEGKRSERAKRKCHANMTATLGSVQ